MPDFFVRRAALSSQTANPEARTVEAVWSTGSAVRRRDMAGSFVERLSLDPAAVDLSRLVGASVLDAHRQTAVRDVLGTVRDARVDGHQGMASLQFSARPEVEPIWQDVLAGILRHVSVGYTVERWQDTTAPATGERIRTAVAWTPIEISVVPTPADPGATIRTGGTMPETATVPAETPATPPPAEIETRAQINAEIRSIARIAGLGAEFVDPLIDRVASADEARRAAFDALAQRGGGTIRTEQTRVEVVERHDDPAIHARQMGEALYARINPQHQLFEPARRYAYATCADMARELLTLRGQPVTGLSPATLITRALHTTSDFGLIVGDTIGRTLRAAYSAAPAGIRRLGRQTTVRDFRAVNKIMLGEAPMLVKLNEHGEIKAGTMAEAKEAYRAETFARKIGVTRQVLVNDDLGAFADLSCRMGQAAAENPFAGSLSLVVKPRLASATRWYVTADAAEIDGLEYAYLAGGEGPQVESKSGWDVDGVEVRVILDFGAGFVDWRGWYANAGA